MTHARAKGKRLTTSATPTASQRTGTNNLAVAPGPAKPLWRRPEGAALALILAAGLVLRAAYLCEVARDAAMAPPGDAASFVDEWARALAAGDALALEDGYAVAVREYPYCEAPLYAHLVALVRRLIGPPLWPIRIIQALSGLVAALLAFFVGRRAFGRAAGLVAAALMSLCGNVVLFESAVLPSALAALLLTLAALWWTLWDERPTFIRALTGGLALGLLAVTQRHGLLCVPMALGWIVWRGALRKQWRSVVAAWLAVLAAVLALTAPAALHNRRTTGLLRPVTVGMGFDLFVANCEDADGVATWSADLMTEQHRYTSNRPKLPAIKERFALRLGLDASTSWAEFEMRLARRAWAFIRNQPDRALALLARKAYFFLSPQEVSADAALRDARDNAPLLRHMPGFGLAFGLALLGVLLWLVEARPRRTRAAGATLVLMLLWAGAYYVSFLPFTVDARHRIVVVPLLFLVGAYGVQRIVDYAATGALIRASAWTLAGAAVCLASSVAWIRYEPRTSPLEARGELTPAQLRELDATIEGARKRLSLDESAYTHTLLGQALSAKQESAEAVRHFQRALEIDPYYFYAHNNMGYELAKQGRAEQAKSHYFTAIELRPDFALAHNNLGNLLLDLGESDKAVVHFEQALEIDPQDLHAQYNLGRAFAMQERYQQAIGHYERARAINPADANVPNNLGLALAALGRPEEAMAQYREALRLNPHYAKAHNNLGYELAKLGRAQAAREQYEEALRLDPSFTLAHNNLGNLLADLGQPDAAIEHFLAALHIDPNDLYADYNLGNVLARQGKLDQAVARFKEALKKNPTDPNVPNNLGLAFASLGRYAEAVAHYAQALKLDPDHVNAHFNLGDVFGETGRLEEAVAQYRRALQLDPNHGLARKHLDTVLGVMKAVQQRQGQH